MRLPFLWFSLSIQSQGHSQGRTRSTWKWRGLWFSVEPKWHHTKHSLVKVSWLSCSSYLHSASTCLLYITVPLVKCNYINAVLPLTSIWRWIILYRRRLACVSPAELISVSLISCLWGPAPALDTAWPLCNNREEVSGSQPKRLFAKCWTGMGDDGEQRAVVSL